MVSTNLPQEVPDDAKHYAGFESINVPPSDTDSDLSVAKVTQNVQDSVYKYTKLYI